MKYFFIFIGCINGQIANYISKATVLQQSPGDINDFFLENSMPMGLARKFESDAEKFESIQKIRDIGKSEYHTRNMYLLDFRH